jgi:protein SCO1/2
VSAPPITAAFSLVNHDGTPVTEASYRGQWQLVQFGFTSCKAVCPRALSKLTAALDTLAASAGPVPLTALYITVDPDRDSPEVMRNYLQTYPRFTGLTGPGDAIDDAKKAFKIFTRRRDAQDGYDVQHTAVTYLVDPDGQPAHYWADVRTAEEIAEDLERIVVTRTTPAEHDGPRGEQAPAASSCCAPAD